MDTRKSVGHVSRDVLSSHGNKYKYVLCTIKMTPNMLKIAVWNANGFVNHSQELNTFILDQHLDLVLVSDTLHQKVLLENTQIYSP